MNKDDSVYLIYIEECLNKIMEYVESKTFDDFRNNKMMQDAIIRNFEVIGEATKNLSIQIKEKYSKMPWKNIAGMRDVLIHDYVKVDLYTVYDAALYDAPALLIEIESILNELKK